MLSQIELDGPCIWDQSYFSTYNNATTKCQHTLPWLFCLPNIFASFLGHMWMMIMLPLPIGSLIWVGSKFSPYFFFFDGCGWYFFVPSSYPIQYWFFFFVSNNVSCFIIENKTKEIKQTRPKPDLYVCIRTNVTDMPYQANLKIMCMFTKSTCSKWVVLPTPHAPRELRFVMITFILNNVWYNEWLLDFLPPS